MPENFAAEYFHEVVKDFILSQQVVGELRTQVRKMELRIEYLEEIRENYENMLKEDAQAIRDVNARVDKLENAGKGGEGLSIAGHNAYIVNAEEAAEGCSFTYDERKCILNDGHEGVHKALGDAPQSHYCESHGEWEEN